MKILLTVFIFSICVFCFAQNRSGEQQKNKSSLKHVRQSANYIVRNDSVFLYYTYSGFYYKSYKGTDYIRELKILIPINSIQTNVSRIIPDSIITIAGTYWIAANWYDGFVKYDSYQGQITFLKMKEHSIKINIYLTEKNATRTTILLNNKHLSFQKKENSCSGF